MTAVFPGSFGNPVAGFHRLLAFLVSFAATFALRADPLIENNPKFKIQPFVPLKAHAFALGDVQLLDGTFKHAMELDRDYLLALEVDRLLHNFRVNAGIPSTAQP